MLKFQSVILSFLLLPALASASPGLITIAYSRYHRQVVLVEHEPKSETFQFKLCSYDDSQNAVTGEGLQNAPCEVLSALKIEEKELETFVHHFIESVEDKYSTLENRRIFDMMIGTTAGGFALMKGWDLAKHWLNLETLARPRRAVAADIVLVLIVGAVYAKFWSYDNIKNKSYDTILGSLYGFGDASRKMIDTDSHTWGYFVEELRKALHKAEQSPKKWLSNSASIPTT